MTIAKSRSFYYSLKPFIPRPLQLMLRRRVIKHKLKSCRSVWPINNMTNTLPPKNWNGWPSKKKFALVLTHDVETEIGHDRCESVMQLEKQLGFKSSFNFVPERYTVSKQLRETIEQNGFEVGVHDLKHDGFLFKSKSSFQKKADRINKYIKEWNVSGFRAGAMLHNLSWINYLNIVYDASTFDTDPFEPQPVGIDTIFPFFVQDKTGRGYIELPYTLPQDFTLFVLMKEKNIDVWIKKLDWIVKHQGMVLVITHPDYMNFPNKNKAFDEFPVKLYQDFLSYIKTKYAGQYWNGLPVEIAQFWRQKHTNATRHLCKSFK